jgi:hypothetical protein
VLAPNPDSVPVYLVNLLRWLLWREVRRTNRKSGKAESTKVPVGFRTGKNCDITNPLHWAAFADVTAAMERSTGAFDGYGFVLGDTGLGEWIIGADLDECLDDDEAIAPWALDPLTILHTYTDKSPGGRGLKPFARIRAADVPEVRRLLGLAEHEFARTKILGEKVNGHHAPGIVLYLGKRFFTVTGRPWHATPEDVALLDLGQIARLAHWLGPKRTTGTTTSERGGDADETEPDEAALRDKLNAAIRRNRRLKERWEGGTQGLIDTTRSGRDMSILAMLVVENFTKGEVRAALRLFQYGKLKDEPPRYFERMWTNTKAAPHVDPEHPPGWEGRRPPPPDAAEDQQNHRGNGQRPPPPPPEPPPEPPPGPSPQPPPEPKPLGVWDPWEDPPLPEWPGGILSRQAEDTLISASQRDGVDFGVLCMTVISAASAAAPKNARFSPYVSTHWTVPPILWCMLIGESGLRKTLLDDVAFAPIRTLQSAMWRDYRSALAAWRSSDKGERGDKPEEPHSFIVNDYTPEALQVILGKTSRGTAVVKDEIAGFFDFARYGGAPSHGSRAFFLSAYEDQSCPVHRIGRDSLYLDHTGMSVFGAIQPDKLAKFTGLESDGLLQRFALLRVRETTVSRALPVKGLDSIHQVIGQLCKLDGRHYASTPEGEAMIRTTEADAKRFAQITDYGVGWKGFCAKAHGTHGRLALILHLLDKPYIRGPAGLPGFRPEIIPAETVHRAAQLARFLLQHARDFYSLIPDGRMDLLRNIGGWLLTKEGGKPREVERIVANQVASNVRGCRPLGSKGIADVLDPFVTGGWLEPESNYPNNRAWTFNPAIRAIFADRESQERERRKLIRDAIRGLGDPVP